MRCSSCAIALAIVFGVAGCSEDAGSGGGSDTAQPADTGGDAATDVGADADADTAAAPTSDYPFPEGFLWGAATAGFQVEMGCPTVPPLECTDPNSDWFEFSTDPDTVSKPGNHLSGQLVHTVGPGHWELYEEDFDRLATELRGNGFRMSIEWSRIFPTATDGIEGHAALLAVANPDAVAHYHAVFAALEARGIRPLVTVNHYTLPTWIHDGVGCHLDLDACSPRGWVDKDRTVAEIARFAGFLGAEYGGEVDLWATLNEPFAVVIPGYLLPTEDRTNPPSVQLRVAEAKTVIEGLVEGHARIYDALKATDTVDADQDGVASQVGVVYNITPTAPKDPESAIDQQGADNVFYLYNLLYLDAVTLGMWDDDADGTAELRADLAGRMDYLGINYYTRIKVEGSEVSVLPDLSPLATFNPFGLELWEEYPQGLHEAVMFAWDRWKLPIYITENGGPVTDEAGQTGLLVRHLHWLQKAIADGADVRGYFFWSLMDNFEWNHGMNMRFGLYAVDDQSAAKTRTPRAAVEVFGAIAERNGLDQAEVDAWVE
jgi:beta-glucosidase/6-phospho-beta-glucosidase/beta-galactosidase